MVDLEKCCFNCLDSLPGDKMNPAEVKVIANMRKCSTEKFGISGVCKWLAAAVPVQEHNNTYDCGFHSMLHMIHYGTNAMYGIYEVSAGKSCLLLMFLLVFYLVLP